jgi:hypothetical protein
VKTAQIGYKMPMLWNIGRFRDIGRWGIEHPVSLIRRGRKYKSSVEFQQVEIWEGICGGGEKFFGVGSSEMFACTEFDELKL